MKISARFDVQNQKWKLGWGGAPSLMVDKCKDINGRQQLSIVIRFIADLNNRRIDTWNVVKEYFLAFLALDKFDVETLANKIVDFLNNLNIPLEWCICLYFDRWQWLFLFFY